MRNPYDRFVAGSLLLGGIFAIVAYASIASGQRNNFADWQLLLGAFFGIANVATGAAMFRQRSWGAKLALPLLALQIVAITFVPLFRFVALAGPKFMVVISDAGLRIEAGFGGSFIAIPFARDGTLISIGTVLDLGIGYAPEPLSAGTVTVGINLAAVYLGRRLLRRPQDQTPPAVQDVVPAASNQSGPWPPINWP